MKERAKRKPKEYQKYESSSSFFLLFLRYSIKSGGCACMCKRRWQVYHWSSFFCARSATELLVRTIIRRLSNSIRWCNHRFCLNEKITSIHAHTRVQWILRFNCQNKGDNALVLSFFTQSIFKFSHDRCISIWLNWQERQTYSISSRSLTWPKQQRETERERRNQRFSELNQWECRRKREMKIGLVIIIFPFSLKTSDDTVGKVQLIGLISIRLGFWLWWSIDAINEEKLRHFSSLSLCSSLTFKSLALMLISISLRVHLFNVDLFKGKILFRHPQRWWKSKWNERNNRWTLLLHRSIGIEKKEGKGENETEGSDEIEQKRRHQLHWCLY